MTRSASANGHAWRNKFQDPLHASAPRRRRPHKNESRKARASTDPRPARRLLKTNAFAQHDIWFINQRGRGSIYARPGKDATKKGTILRLLAKRAGRGALIPGRIGGLYYGALEAGFEAKASKDRLSGHWGGRGVSGAGGWCRRHKQGACGGSLVAERRAASRRHARRGRNLRRQFGDVLRLRQGSRWHPSGQCRTRQGLRRLPRLRAMRRSGPVRRRPVCSGALRPVRRGPMRRGPVRCRHRGLCRLRRLQLQLLPVVGRLPYLLEHDPDFSHKIMRPSKWSERNRDSI